MDWMDERRGAGAVLTFGFGTTVAMWAVGYFTHLPGVHISSGVVFTAIVGCFMAGAVMSGAMTRRSWRTGLFMGLWVALLNLMVMGSLLAGDRPNAVTPSAPVYLAGFLAGCVAIGAGGGWIGGRMRGQDRSHNWTSAFACVAATATLLLITVGGFVTSKEAGLAVVDWPNSFGYNMFLYPLSRMTGGIYYEHAHRLIGSLVGLTVLTLTIHLWVVDSRRWVKMFAIGVLLAVAIQGILGGLCVTGYFTFSQDPADTAPNIALAIVHGIFGQTILGGIVALAVVTSTAWRAGLPAQVRLSATSDRLVGVLLVLVLVLQLVVGAILRHIAHGLMLHVTLAVIALGLTLAAGLRAWLSHEDQPILSRCGKTMVALAAIQLALGLAALVATGMATSSRTDVPATEAIITTAHQAVGALLLSAAVVLMAWTFRLLRQGKTAPASHEAVIL